MTVESPGIKSNSARRDEAIEVVPLGIEQDLEGVCTSSDIKRKYRDTRVWLVGLLSSLKLRGVGGANRVEFLESNASRRVQDLHLKRLVSELEGCVGAINGDRSIGVHTPGNGGLSISDLVLEQDLASAVNEADTSLDGSGKAISPSNQWIRVNARTSHMQRLDQPRSKRLIFEECPRRYLILAECQRFAT